MTRKIHHPMVRTLALLFGTAVALPALSLSAMAQQDAPPPPPTQGAEQGPPPQWQGRGGPRPPDPQRRLEMMQKRLSLSDDQTTQLKSIFADSQTKMEALRGNTSLAPQDRRAQMMSLREQERSKVEAVLTPDQKKKFKEMEQRQRERMEHGGRGGPGGPGGSGQPPSGSEPPPPPPSNE